MSGRRSPTGSPRSRFASPACSASMRCRRFAWSRPIGACSRSAARSSAPTHAVMAVLLMVGISLFTVPTPDFGPPILAMALWAAVLLLLLARRRAGAAAILVRARRRRGASAAHQRGRPYPASARSPCSRPRPSAGARRSTRSSRGSSAAVAGRRPVPASALARGRRRQPDADASSGCATPESPGQTRRPGCGFSARSSSPMPALPSSWCWRAAGRGSAPARRPPLRAAPVDPFAATFVKVFALVPALLATIVAVLLGVPLPIGGRGAARRAVRARRRRRRRRQRRALPSAHSRLRLGRPADRAGDLGSGGDGPACRGRSAPISGRAAGGRHGPFLRRQFRAPDRPSARRSSAATRHTAALVALAAPSRPSVYFDADPARSPWVTPADIRQKGRRGRVAGGRHESGAAAGNQGAFSRSRSRSAAQPSSGRCRAACRRCGSAGA